MGLYTLVLSGLDWIDYEKALPHPSHKTSEFVIVQGHSEIETGAPIDQDEDFISRTKRSDSHAVIMKKFGNSSADGCKAFYDLLK